MDTGSLYREEPKGESPPQGGEHATGIDSGVSYADNTFLSEVESVIPSRADIIAIGGGKGGIGKSILAANLGVHLASIGKKAILLDADLGGANLHTCLGMNMPRQSLSDFVSRRIDNLQEIVASTTVPGLGLISGAMDLLEAANPKYTQKIRILREVSRLDVDYVIIDLGGGTGFNILDFFLLAKRGVLMVSPEPTSVENAYRFLKAAYYRRLKALEMNWDLKPIVHDVIRNPGKQGLRTPADLLRRVAEQDPEGGAYLQEQMAKFPFDLVVNQVRSPEEEELGTAMQEACRKYFGINMNHLGNIPYDDAVWQSVRHRRPLIMDSPDAMASQSVRQIAFALGMGGE